MYAVIVEVDTSGAEREEGLRRLREEIVPAISQAPGFQSGNWTRHPSEDKGLSLVVFDTEENAQATASRFEVGANPGPGVTVVRSEVREVVATA
jgi:heme-degrading monooxygenase HmoA